jgi:hypothetical protein
MAKPKQIHSNIIVEGKFDDIIPPNFELFNITLKEKDYQIQDAKTLALISSDKTFEIKIDATKVAKSFISALSDELKVAFSLSFAPFDRETSSYNFYINRYAGDMTARKNILTGIFDTLEEFQKDYFKKIEQTKPVFEKAKEEIKDFHTDEFEVKFSTSLNTFVVLAKAYIGGDSFRKLASCSKKIGKLMDSPELTTLFDNPKYAKKSYFIINQGDYIVINDYIRSLKKNNETFLTTQETFYTQSEENRFKALEFDKPNLFDYRIKINDERKCFEFFCKGFEVSPPYQGYVTPRNLLQVWALNFILSSPISQMKNAEYKIEHDLRIEGFGQESLVYQKDSSKKDKVYYVPFTEIDKLERIHQNYLKEDEMWSRQQFTVKHACSNFQKVVLNADMKTYPAIYLNGDGQAYFILESRESSSRKVDATIINLKGIKITPDEFKHFMTEHPFSEQIQNNTKALNAQLWAGPSAVFNYESIEAAYNDVVMAYRINNMPKTPKINKRLKI